MFIKPETLPDEVPPISAVTDQKELCERYSAPAPPASTMTARRVSCACEPITRKIAARIIANTATKLRPARGPLLFVIASLTRPPKGEQRAIAMKGNIEYNALVFRLRPRTSAR